MSMTKRYLDLLIESVQMLMSDGMDKNKAIGIVAQLYSEDEEVIEFWIDQHVESL